MARRFPAQLTLKPQWWLAGIAISMLGALAAAAASLIKAVRLPVLAAAQALRLAAGAAALADWSRARSRSPVFAAAAASCWFGDSLVSGFAVLAAIAARRGAGAAGDPGLVLSLGQRSARRPLAVWFWADSRSSSPGCRWR